MTQRPRIVITGMGMVCPLGCGVETSWQRLLQGESGIDKVTSFEVDDMACRIAGQIPLSTDEDADAQGLFNPDQWMPAHERRRIDDFIVYALVAARQAIKASGWKPADEEQASRSGVVFGSGIGGLNGIYSNSVSLFNKGARRVSPFFIPSSLINLSSGTISIEHGWQGPNHSVVTACATGAHAIGDAAEMIRRGDADIMVAGSAEATVSRIGLSGFASMKALSTHFNDQPQRASRPWDKDHDGFVMGEGAGALVLEDYQHAKKRGATIHGEIIGYGMSGDAYHVTAPHSEGRGAFLAMQAAVRNSAIAIDTIDYVNAHGTSTPLGDEIEIKAVKKLFGTRIDALAMSSTKSAIGHLLGAAGSVEAIFSLLALRDQVAPPTLNLETPAPGCDGINLVAQQAQQRTIRHVLTNSFGFGGTNASLIFAPPP
ncbi:MAG: beta-ketoacyl-ACP synthase II [Alphaproteobacteria bacterium GM202ARS2]|nr:beta-ketoacyl-ACP synthase II [Alphaproteobacteria bacterium GM202ARS2]